MKGKVDLRFEEERREESVESREEGEYNYS